MRMTCLPVIILEQVHWSPYLVCDPVFTKRHSFLFWFVQVFLKMLTYSPISTKTARKDLRSLGLVVIISYLTTLKICTVGSQGFDESGRNWEWNENESWTAENVLCWYTCVPVLGQQNYFCDRVQCLIESKVHLIIVSSTVMWCLHFYFYPTRSVCSLEHTTKHISSFTGYFNAGSQ